MLSFLIEGRFDLGIGIGDIPEQAAWGEPPYADAAVRMEWLEEVVAALRLAWTGHPVEFTGRHVRLRDACCPLAAPSPPPVVIGAGGSNRLVRRAVSYADEINVYYHPDCIATARKVVQKSGRVVALSACIDEYDLVGEHLSGTMLERLRRWQEQGIDRLFVTLYEPFALLPLICQAVPHMQPAI